MPVRARNRKRTIRARRAHNGHPPACANAEQIGTSRAVGSLLLARREAAYSPRDRQLASMRNRSIAKVVARGLAIV